RRLFLKLDSPSSVANLLGIEYSRMTFTLYKAKNKYTNFSIKKRNGQERLIQAPSCGLRDIQNRLNQVLHCIYQPKKSVYSFVRGTDRNIIDRARQHVGKHFVFNIDL